MYPLRIDVADVPTRSPLLLSIIQVESHFDTFAVRYEPNLDLDNDAEKFAKLHIISVDTEKILQCMSWGLTQILGVTARDLGYRGPLTKLVEPILNVRYGFEYLSWQLERYDGDVPTAVSAYNRGTAYKDKNGKFVNQNYVDRVLSNLKMFEHI